MRKNSRLPRYKCLNCDREMSQRKFICKYCGSSNLKLIRFGWNGIIYKFDMINKK